MGLRYPNQSSGRCFFVTTTFSDWNQLGAEPGMYEELVGSLKFCLNKYEARLLGYVLMPSHIHLVVAINGEQLGGFMRDFKKYVAQKSAVTLGLKSKEIWMPRYDRVEIISPDVLRTKLKYIHDNPVKAGLCSSAIDWRWSSARAYEEGGMTDIRVWKEWA